MDDSGGGVEYLFDANLPKNLVCFFLRFKVMFVGLGSVCPAAELYLDNSRLLAHLQVFPERDHYSPVIKYTEILLLHNITHSALICRSKEI